MKLFTHIRKKFLNYTASVYLGLGHPETAIPLYEQELDANPQHLSLYPLIAAYYMDKGDYEHAQQLLERGLTIDPDDPEINQSLIKVLHRTGAPVKRIIPYLRIYFAHKLPPVPYKVPVLVKWLAKLFKPHVNVERMMHRVENSQTRWDMWAYEVLTRYDASHDQFSNPSQEQESPASQGDEE